MRRLIEFVKDVLYFGLYRRHRICRRARIKHILLAWFFLYAASNTVGIAGPFATQAGCERVRATFANFIRGSITTPCVTDYYEGER